VGAGEPGRPAADWRNRRLVGADVVVAGFATAAFGL